MPETVGAPWMWAGFFAFVAAMIFLDLFVLGGRHAKVMTVRSAALWSLVWVAISFAFNGLLWWWLQQGPGGRELADAKAIEFFTGYVIEKSLAVDNVFVWLMLFNYFAIPGEYQHRVLMYGVIGAIVMRTIMVFAGTWVITEFHWILYVFGAFLVVTGIKMLVFADKEQNLEDNVVLKWIRGHMRVTPQLDGERFFVVRDGVRWATPLFLVLVLVEFTDLVFAVDSIPAIFAITSDPFIVLTSNVFAILGLRAMYFLLRDVADRFHLLKYGLAIILVFIGVKLLLIDLYKIPTMFALAVVAAILAATVVASLITPPKKPRPPQRSEVS